MSDTKAAPLDRTEYEQHERTSPYQVVGWRQIANALKQTDHHPI